MTEATATTATAPVRTIIDLVKRFASAMPRMAIFDRRVGYQSHDGPGKIEPVTTAARNLLTIRGPC